MSCLHDMQTNLCAAEIFQPESPEARALLTKSRTPCLHTLQQTLAQPIPPETYAWEELLRGLLLIDEALVLLIASLQEVAALWQAHAASSPVPRYPDSSLSCNSAQQHVCQNDSSKHKPLCMLVAGEVLLSRCCYRRKAPQHLFNLKPFEACFLA